MPQGFFSPLIWFQWKYVENKFTWILFIYILSKMHEMWHFSWKDHKHTHWKTHISEIPPWTTHWPNMLHVRFILEITSIFRMYFLLFLFVKAFLNVILKIMDFDMHSMLTKITFLETQSAHFRKWSCMEKWYLMVALNWQKFSLSTWQSAADRFGTQ